MKILQILLLSVVGLATAAPFPLSSVTQTEAGNEATSSELEKRATFPSVSGLKFNIDGSTVYFAGTNAYWIGFLTSNTDVDTVMDHLQCSGLKVLRVWGASLLLP
jgi:mannan endo-1,4-beta-mannosidase